MPAADEEVPARPQPQCEQPPPPHRITRDHPERVAEGGDTAGPGEGEALPGEKRAEEGRPDEIPDHRMPCHLDLPAAHVGSRPGCIASARAPATPGPEDADPGPDTMFPPIVSHRAPMLGPSRPPLAETVTDVPGFACPPRNADAGRLWGLAHAGDGAPRWRAGPAPAPAAELVFPVPHSNECSPAPGCPRFAVDGAGSGRPGQPAEIGDHGDASGSRSPLGRARWLVVGGRRRVGAGA